MVNSTDPDTGVTSLVLTSYEDQLTDNMFCGEKAGKDSCQVGLTDVPVDRFVVSFAMYLLKATTYKRVYHMV